MRSDFRWIFEARACAPCIVFLDELDAVGPGAQRSFEVSTDFSMNPRSHDRKLVNP